MYLGEFYWLDNSLNHNIIMTLLGKGIQYKETSNKEVFANLSGEWKKVRAVQETNVLWEIWTD